MTAFFLVTSVLYHTFLASATGKHSDTSYVKAY